MGSGLVELIVGLTANDDDENGFILFGLIGIGVTGGKTVSRNTAPTSRKSSETINDLGIQNYL